MKCIQCNTEIINENINIQTDIAQCQSCHYIFKISENISSGEADGFDLKNPPPGAWIREEYNQIVIGASTKSPIAFFLVPFMIVWTGGALGGIFGTQIISGEFNPILTIFGFPFIIGAVIFWSVALMAIWGKVELKLDKEGGQVFTGLGNIGLKKLFTWEEINLIKENQGNLKYPGSQGYQILMEGKKRISFGTGLNDSRRYYLYRSLKMLSSKMKANKKLL